MNLFFSSVVRFAKRVTTIVINGDLFNDRKYLVGRCLLLYR